MFGVSASSLNSFINSFTVSFSSFLSALVYVFDSGYVSLVALFLFVLYIFKLLLNLIRYKLY